MRGYRGQARSHGDAVLFQVSRRRADARSRQSDEGLLRVQDPEALLKHQENGLGSGLLLVRRVA